MKYLHVEGCGVWLHHHVMLDLVLFDAANEKIEEKTINVASSLTLVAMVSDLDLEVLKGHNNM